MQAYKEGTLLSIPVARRKVAKISPRKNGMIVDLLFKGTESAIYRPDQSNKEGVLSPRYKIVAERLTKIIKLTN